MTFLGISPFSPLICVGIYKENIYTYCHASVIWRLDLKAIQPATFVYHVALLLQIKSKIEEVKFFFWNKRKYAYQIIVKVVWIIQGCGICLRISVYPEDKKKL